MQSAKIKDQIDRDRAFEIRSTECQFQILGSQPPDLEALQLGRQRTEVG
jgi:hypothetical protein